MLIIVGFSSIYSMTLNNQGDPYVGGYVYADHHQLAKYGHINNQQYLDELLTYSFL